MKILHRDQTVPSHQGGLTALSLVPNRNVPPMLRVPWNQWNLRETQSYRGSSQPDMDYTGQQSSWGTSGAAGPGIWGLGHGEILCGPGTGRCGGLSPPGIVVQGSFPLLQGQVTLHGGFRKLLCSWLEEKAQEPSGDR